MSLRLQVLSEVQDEFDAAHAYLNREAPGAGDSFAFHVQEAFDAMIENPEPFSFVETLPSSSGYRRALLRKYHYTVVFKVIGESVAVVAVAHTSRRPNYWLKRL
jgi:plasmid stabilization system protein ParE